MKLVKRATKEIKSEDFTAVIKKLSNFDMLEIQRTALKIKNVDGKVDAKNIMAFTETDITALRINKVIRGTVKWNIETDDSTPESPKYLPITEETLKGEDFPADIFTLLETEITAFNEPAEAETKN